MTYTKQCPFCGEFFDASRIDQIFCSSKCRNGFNNDIQAKLNAPYQSIAKNLKTQDELLEKYSSNPNILFHSENFKQYGIIMDHAFRFHYDKSNNLTNIIFVKYQLVLVKQSLYKIAKS
ncbi:MAG: hypothetical protein WCK67_08590 [bacterium]